MALRCLLPLLHDEVVSLCRTVVFFGDHKACMYLSRMKNQRGHGCALDVDG